MIRDLIMNNRSYRRFYESEAIPMEKLREMVDLARFSATGGNFQPLKFMLSNDPETNKTIYPKLEWAGFLKDWEGPEEGERASAYVIILNDTEIRKSPGCDHGIAAQSILLGAVEMGYGGCMVGSIHREQLRADLKIPERYEISLVIALGRPKETVVLEEMNQDGSIEYYRTEDGVHHVPKRSLDSIVVTEDDFK